LLAATAGGGRRYDKRTFLHHIGHNQSGELCHEWRGQEIAFKRVQDLLTKAGVV